MSGRFDGVITPPNNPEVALLIAASQVSSDVPAGGEAGFITLGLPEVTTEHRWPSWPKGEHAVDVVRRLHRCTVWAEDDLLLVVALEDHRLHARHRLSHGARADGHGGKIGNHDSPGFGLPPVAMGGDAGSLIRPADDLRVEGLSDAGNEAECREIVCPGGLGTCGHEHPKCGWRGVPDGDALIRQRGVPAVNLKLTLIDDARHAMGQWGDDPIRGPCNPARVSGAP